GTIRAFNLLCVSKRAVFLRSATRISSRRILAQALTLTLHSYDAEKHVHYGTYIVRQAAGTSEGRSDRHRRPREQYQAGNAGSRLPRTGKAGFPHALSTGYRDDPSLFFRNP